MDSPAANNFERCLRDGLQLLEPLQQVLPAWYEGLVALAGAAGERLRIGVVGITSSGKSTFINALLGEMLLPATSVATTNVPVICRAGPSRVLTASYRDGRVEVFRDAAVTPTLLAALCSEKSNPRNVKDVGHLLLELPTCLLRPELEIIDTPGTDAYGLAEHETITLQKCISGFDIAIFMTHLSCPFGASDAEVLRPILDQHQRTLFVISHSDIEREDHERGRRTRTVAEKLRQHVDGLRAKLAHYPELRHSRVVAVSAHHAALAAGDRREQRWRESNFEAVLGSLDAFVTEFSDVLTVSRERRLKKVLAGLSGAISDVLSDAGPGEVDGTKGALASDLRALEARTVRTAGEEALRSEVDRLDSASAVITGHIADLQARAGRELDVGATVAELMLPFARLKSWDVTGCQRASDAFPWHWEQRISGVTRAVDTARSRCRTAFEPLALPPGREKVKQRAVDPGEVPSVKRRISESVEAYDVEIPRAGWFVGIRDKWFGKRIVQRTRVVRTVDIDQFRRDLSAYLRRSLVALSEFADGQAQTMRDLFLEPVQTALERQRRQLTELVNLRQLASRQRALLPGILQGLLELEAALAPGDRPVSEPPGTVVIDEPPVADTASPALAPGDLARGAIATILVRAREGAAISRFWSVAQRAAGSSDPLRRLLLVAGDLAEASRLAAYLTRDRTGRPPAWEAAEDGTYGADVPHPQGQTRLVALGEEPAVEAAAIRDQCHRADAIGVLFRAAQPSRSLKRLLLDPSYPVVSGFSGKAFVLCPSAAAYDYHLANLVVEVVGELGNTAFADSPIYLYEAGRYDARYTDFVELAREMRATAGSARELKRRWKMERRLSTRPPFAEETLEQAYEAVRDQEEAV